MQNSQLLKKWPNVPCSLINTQSKPITRSSFVFPKELQKEPFSSQKAISLSSENQDSFSQELPDFPLFPQLSTQTSSKETLEQQPENKNLNLSESFSRPIQDISQSENENRRPSIIEFEKKACLLKTFAIKKSNNRTKNEKKLFQVKRLLAILKNWKEVSKRLPIDREKAYKQKIVEYIRHKMFPLHNKQRKEELFRLEHMKEEEETEKSSELVNVLFRERREEFLNSNSEENEKNLFLENEDYNNFFNFESKGEILDSDQKLFWTAHEETEI